MAIGVFGKRYPACARAGDRAPARSVAMMLCVRLIDKVQDEWYGREYFNYHESELKFIDSKDYPGHYEMEIEHISDNYKDYFKKYPRIYKQAKGKDKHEKAFNIARINEERAHKLLFKILEQNIRRWWD
jgi:hypothetical protein